MVEEEQEKADVERRAMEKEQDKEHLCSLHALDWKVLHEERRVKTAFRSLSQQAQQEANTERVQKHRGSPKHSRKAQSHGGMRKIHKVHWLKVEQSVDNPLDGLDIWWDNSVANSYARWSHKDEMRLVF